MTTKLDPETARREFAELLKIEKQLTTLSVEAKRLADRSGLSRRGLARRMGNLSTSHLQRLLQGMAYKASIETLAKFAWACGHELKISFVPKLNAEIPREKVAAVAVEVAKRVAAETDCCRDNVVHLDSRRAEYAASAGMQFGRMRQPQEGLQGSGAYGAY